MVAPLDAPWNVLTISDANLNVTTYGQGTSFPATWAVDRLFWRTDTNIMYKNKGTFGTPKWDSMFNVYGDGNNGAVTDPVAPTQSLVQYTDLTFNNNTTWTMTGYGHLIIFVSGTLTIAASRTWTITGGIDSGGLGGSAGGSTGGTGGGPFTVIILANTVVAGASATIAVTNNSTAAGVGGTGGSSGIISGANGHLGSLAQLGSLVLGNTRQVGQAGLNNSQPAADNSAGGTGASIANASRWIHMIKDILNYHSGAGHGGGSGSLGNTTLEIAPGGGGGSGGSTIFAAGGNGGAGGAVLGNVNAGGGAGGGGGGSTALILITDVMDSDLVMTATGLIGGAGGNSNSASAGRGGGGGGGSALVMLIAPSDSGTRTPTGGAGGAAGSGTGNGGVAGSTGGTASVFIDLTKIIKSV